MNKQLRPILVVLTALGLTACGAANAVVPAGDQHDRLVQYSRALPAPAPTPTPPPPGLLALVGDLAGNVVGCVASLDVAGCHLLQNQGYPATATFKNGFGVADLRSAYGLPQFGATANGATIAIVVAYHAPNAERDLAAYRKTFGLPPCTSGNGCFKSTYPGLTLLAPQSSVWAMETDIDLAMASAACPTCRLLLVEAPSADIGVLASAVDSAAAAHPAAISNSFGVFESSQNASLASHWHHPGIAITASAGDAKTPMFPATSRYVTAVGATALVRDPRSARGWAELPWNNSGAGCSQLETMPAWQNSSSGCTTRAVADVSLVGAANPGIAIYDSAAGGWIVVNGTSVAAPFVAGLYAAAHDYPSDAVGAAGIYAKAAALNRLGASPAFSQGTPNGLGAF